MADVGESPFSCSDSDEAVSQVIRKDIGSPIQERSRFAALNVTRLSLTQVT